MRTPILIALTGPPGSGKSTVAAGISRELGFSVIAKDVVEAAVLRSGVEHDRLGFAGYEVLTALAETQLRNGVSVVLDSVATFARIRTQWRELASEVGAAFVLLECRVDPAAHRARVARRRRGIPGWPELTWEQVRDTAAQYEPDDNALIVDTTCGVDEAVAAATRHVRAAQA